MSSNLDPQIYVRGFNKYTKDQQLKSTFQKYGKVKEVRKIRDYAFVVYNQQEQADNAVKQMDGNQFNGNKLKVQIAGQPRRSRGPQPSDQCRFCHKTGHWKNDCPQFRRDKRSSRRRRYRSSSSDSSSSSSSDSSDRHRRRRRKQKKIKKYRKRSESSSSSSSSSSKSSKHSSQNEKNNQK